MDDLSRPSVALVTSRTPFGVGEAFVLREAIGLQQAGVSVFLFPARIRREPVIHSSARAWTSQAASWTSLRSMISATAMWFACHPLRFMRTLWWLLAITHRAKSEAPSSESQRYRDAGLVEEQNKLFRRFRTTKNLVAFGRAIQLARQVRRERITHIHASWASYPATVAMVAARITGVPWSFSAHRWDLLEGNALREKVSSATFVRAISSTGVELLGALGSKTPIHLIHVGIECQDLKPVVEGAVRFISIGHLISRKNFNDVVRAASELKKSGSNFTCEIVGGGPCETELRSLIDELGLASSVELVGPLDNDVLLERLRTESWTAVVHTALHEGIPVALMEAMAAGIPVVAYAAGDTMELVSDGRNGFLSPPGEVGAVARAMSMLALEPSLRERLGDQARETVTSDFNVENSASSLRALFLSRATEDLGVR